MDYENGDATVKKILNNLDFYIVPSLNVDGYSYTWSGILVWLIISFSRFVISCYVILWFPLGKGNAVSMIT